MRQRFVQPGRSQDQTRGCGNAAQQEDADRPMRALDVADGALAAAHALEEVAAVAVAVGQEVFLPVLSAHIPLPPICLPPAVLRVTINWIYL